MRATPFKCLILAASLSLAAPVFADADPSMHEVYEAAEGGHLEQAQRMIQQVLKDHPQSAKAHYVAAEVYQREGNYSLSRDELAQAEKIDPGLSFAKAGSVDELRSALAAHGAATSTTPMMHRSETYVTPAPERHASFPWGFVIFVVVIIAVISFVMNRRRYAVGGFGPRPDGMQGGYGGGYGYGAPPAGGGIGSSLASGLAVGAGVVAGEELAHHFLDGDRERVVERDYTPVDNGGSRNSDMGGNDFGVSDNSSWDSGNSGSDFGGGGGGDDWT